MQSVKRSSCEALALQWRSLAHGRGGARGEEAAVAKGKKPSKLRARRRKLPGTPEPTPPVAPRELTGVPPGLRLPSGEAAVNPPAAGEPAGSASGDGGGCSRLRKPAAGAHAAGSSRFFCTWLGSGLGLGLGLALGLGLGLGLGAGAGLGLGLGLGLGSLLVLGRAHG